MKGIKILLMMVVIGLFWRMPASQSSRADAPPTPAHLSGLSLHQPGQEADRILVESVIIRDDEPDPDLEPGFPVQTEIHGGVSMTGPVVNVRVGNIDPDPQLEILVSGLAQGPLYAFNHDGTWVLGWPVNYYPRQFFPTLGNLYEPSPELEIFSGQFVYREPETPPGPLLALTGAGSWLKGWPKDSEYDVSAPATLADLNGDGVDEIIVYEGRFSIYAYLSNGNLLPGWPIEASDSAHAVADLDGDGDLEIVTITDWTSTGGYIVAYHHDGHRMEGLYVFVQPTHHVFPVIGDVDGDHVPEIMVYTSRNDYPFNVLLVISPDGTIEQELPNSFLINNAYCGSWNPPALADMDGDSIPEIVIGIPGVIAVYKGDGRLLPGFPVVWGSCFNYDLANNAPVVGDINGDGFPEIVFTNQNENGSVWAFDRFGQLLPQFPKTMYVGFGGVPAIADLDLDGRNEIIVLNEVFPDFAGLYDRIWVYDLGGENHGKIEWGQAGGGPQNWGSYPPPPLLPGVNLYLHEPGMIGMQPGPQASFGLHYGNLGVPIAPSVTLTATLPVGMVYVGDNSGVTPVVNAHTVAWQLPDLGYLFDRSLSLTVQLPSGATYGDRFAVAFELASGKPEADPADNTLTVELAITRSSYLPIIRK